MKAPKMLSRTDEALLIRAAKNGCLKSMQRLYESFLPMIESACRKKGIVQKEMIEDLRQEMYFSLKIAVEKFDFSKGLRFSCYFRYYVKDKILRYIRKNSSYLYIGDGAKNKKIQNNFHRLYAQQSASGKPLEEIYQNISEQLLIPVQDIKDFHAATDLENFFCADFENEIYAHSRVSEEQPENILLENEKNRKILSVFQNADREYALLGMPISSTYLVKVLKKSITIKACAEMNNTSTKQVKRCLEIYTNLVKKNTKDQTELF
jgi:RNA polymerase sigma factor (sigma-70 family)